MRFGLRISLLVSLLTASTWAQLASTTSLVGNVTDPGGAAILGASITAVNTGTQEAYTATTNSEGFYNIQFVKIGTYKITVTHPGFEAFTKSNILVQTNQTVRTDFPLKVGQVSQEVTVTAAPPPIATDEASISQIINSRQTVDLPLNGRDPLQLAVITPGVTPGLKGAAGNPGGGEDFIAAGTREIQNSVSLDGVSLMNNLITTTTFRPSVDSIQETQIETGTYQAQYGGYLGLQMNLVTKSGTNSLHGALFEFARNDYFDARGYFEKPTAPQAPFHQNQYGFEVDGPVVIPKLYNGRDRTFFMADYEGLRQSQVLDQLDSVLTPLMRQGNFSEYSKSISLAGYGTFPGNIVPASMISTQAQKALQYMPLPNLPGISNNYLASVLTTDTTNQTLERVDQNFGEKVRLFFRYAWENTTLQNGNTNPFNGYNQPVQDRNFVIGYTQVITPNLINDLRFGRQYTTIDSINFFHTQALANAGTALGIPGFTSNLSNSGLPDISIAGYMSIGGQNMASSNWYETDSTLQGNDLLSWTHGAHTLQTGFEIRRLVTDRTANNNPRGFFNFAGSISGFSPADYMLGLPISVTTSGALFPGGAIEYRDGFFVVDKWQISSRLTLNLGLRYELPTVPESTTGNGTILNPQQTAFIPSPVPQVIPFNYPTHNDWAPRIGLAYRLSDKWVARGGWGLYYNPNQLNTYTLTTTNPPFSAIYTYNATPSNPILSFSNPTPTGALGKGPVVPNAFTMNPNLPTATMSQWSGDVERALWSGAALDVQYLGSHMYHLDRSYYNNTPLPGPGNIQSRRPNQLFGVIRTIQNDEVANYEAMNVVFRQNFNHGLTALLSYTWSHDLDISTDSNGGGAPMNPYNWAGDYGNSNWDIRHRLTGSFNYQLPFLQHSSNPIERFILGNWQINGIITAQTGLPFNVTVPGDYANTGVGSQRPNLIATASSTCGDGHLKGCIYTGAYTLPFQYTYGTAGRNLLHGPDMVDLDASLFKNFPIKERAQFELRLEMFNSLNHPSFSNPAATFTTASFGNIGSTSNNNREIQIAGKLVF